MGTIFFTMAYVFITVDPISARYALFTLVKPVYLFNLFHDGLFMEQIMYISDSLN
jgi:hypothetical protein